MWLHDLIGEPAARFSRLLRTFMTSVVIIGGVAVPAAAQTLSAEDRAALEAQKDALFGQTLRNPADLDAIFAFADISARLGDNEAAVTALERMLLFNPNLTRVQLELGVLYFRMASFELARSYFEKALAANPPPEVKARVQQYLREMTVVDASERVTGYVFFGAQHQTDANAAPGSPLIHSPVGDALLSSQFVKQADTNIFGAGSALYTYDLGNQDRDAIEVLGSGFANHYFKVSRLDLTLAEITAGPRFNYLDISDDLKSVSLKPYLIVNNVTLGGSEYFNTYGGGGEAQFSLWDDLSLRAIFEYRKKGFTNASDRPLSTGLNGSDKLVSVQLTKPVPLIADSQLTMEFDFLDQSTQLAYYSNKAYGGSIAYSVRYDDPTGNFNLPWQTTLFGGRIWSDYAAPDPCCNTSGSATFFSPSSRLDRHWRWGVTQSIRVMSNVDVLLQFQRDIVSSNLSLYAYTSNSVLVGTQVRF
jgi:tetratricopeptide (TPR) repeat protein